MTGRKILIVTLGIAMGGVVAALAIRNAEREKIHTITGVVLRQDPEVRNQVPVAGAEIIAGTAPGAKATSGSSGLFHLTPQTPPHAEEPVTLTIRQPEYRPLETTIAASHELYVFHLAPIPRPPPKADGPSVTVINPRVRYAVTETSTVNAGSAAETFEVVNRGNGPCNGQKPCSPDGKWKAAIAGKTLDAGDGNSFEDVRVTCIAGPCPFTRIEKDNFSSGGKRIQVLVRNWSDTVTFLLEAEVTHTMASDAIRQLFPSKFDQSMDFTLPATAQGPSIEAEMGGQDIVYPLGPALILSWANCSVTTARDGTKLFHCDLKRGYRLR